MTRLRFGKGLTLLIAALVYRDRAAGAICGTCLYRRPQNGEELFTHGGTPDGELARAYLDLIDAYEYFED